MFAVCAPCSFGFFILLPSFVSCSSRAFIIIVNGQPPGPAVEAEGSSTGASPAVEEDGCAEGTCVHSEGPPSGDTVGDVLSSEDIRVHQSPLEV
eukprot:1642868-Rhodomonas_salina.1